MPWYHNSVFFLTWVTKWYLHRYIEESARIIFVGVHSGNLLFSFLQILCVSVVIAGSVIQNYLDDFRSNDLTPVSETSASAGWLIFVGVIGIIYESIFILQRFLNIVIINNYFLYVIVVVSSLEIPVVMED